MSAKQNKRAAVRETGASRRGPKSSSTTFGTIPFVARWSGEHDSPMPIVLRRGARGIAYADERSYDRDDLGILWTRTPSQPGRDKPQLGNVHGLRQRLCMTGLRCQVCGGPADLTSDGVLWLIDANPSDLLPRGVAELTAHPPVCRPCAHQSVRLCPHLRDKYVALRVRSFAAYGVSGALYCRNFTEPLLYGAGTVALGDPLLPWIRASQLVMSLNDFTVIDLDDPTA